MLALAGLAACQPPEGTGSLSSGSEPMALISGRVQAESSRFGVYFRTSRGSEISSCSGTLISRRLVLTAAHCLHKIDGGVHVFATEIQNPGANDERAVEVDLGMASHWRLAPGFKTDLPLNENQFDVDMALLRLNQEIPDRMNFISLVEPNWSWRSKDPLYFVGAGRRDPNIDSAAGESRVEEALVRGSVSLQSAEGFGFFSAPAKGDQLLIKNNSSLAPMICVGDSGGSLITRDAGGNTRLVGVTVGTFVYVFRGQRQCANFNMRFLMVNPYRDWIRAAAEELMSLEE